MPTEVKHTENNTALHVLTNTSEIPVIVAKSSNTDGDNNAGTMNLISLVPNSRVVLISLDVKQRRVRQNH